MSERRRAWCAVALLLLLPLVWLWPCVFGERTFVPYDLAEFPPAGLALEPAQLAAVREGANHDATEPPIWFLPEMALVRDEVFAGRWPAWNPHSRGGTPVFANSALGLCYPPNWVALCTADPADGIVFVVWINLVIGGLLAFGFFRALGIGLFAAWFGAAAFQLSAPMATNAYFWMRLATFVWLPGVLWALLALARGDRLRPGPLTAAAAAIGVGWVTGFPPFATATSLLAALWWTWLMVDRARITNTRAVLHTAWRGPLAFVLGALLAMPQLLPALCFFPESSRPVEPTHANMVTNAFDAYGLLGYLAPDLLGHPTAAAELPYRQSPLALLLDGRTDAAGKAVLPSFNYTEYGVFFGTFALLLACAGAFGARRPHRAFAIGAVGLLLALGLFLPGFDRVCMLPLLENVWPMRWLPPATLPLCWLAALGVERLCSAGGRRLPLALGALALAAAAAFAWTTSLPATWHAADPTWAVQRIAAHHGVAPDAVVRHVQDGAAPGLDRFSLAFARTAEHGRAGAIWLAAAGLLLLAVGLWRRADAGRILVALGCAANLAQLAHHGSSIVPGRALRHSIATPVHAFLRERAAEAAPDGGFTFARASIAPTLPAQLPPGELMVRGARDLHFCTYYDRHSGQAIEAMLGDWWGPRTAGKGYLVLSLPDALPAPGEPPRERPYPFTSPLEHPLLDLFGVRYLLSTEPLPHGGTRVGPEFRGPGGEFFVYERPRALPRAFTVPVLRVLPTDADVVAALADPSFEPRAAALVPRAERGLTAERAPSAPARTVRFTTDLPTVVELDIGPGAAQWLVLADTHLPGWSATVDGEWARVRRGNHCQRVVQIPERACVVRFTYATPGLAAGSALAGFATLVLLAVAFAHRRATAARAS